MLGEKVHNFTHLKSKKFSMMPRLCGLRFCGAQVQAGRVPRDKLPNVGGE